MSDDNESDEDYLDDYNDYYMAENCDDQQEITDDPEYYEVQILSHTAVNDLFENLAVSVSESLCISSYLCKFLLYKNNWSIENTISYYRGNQQYFEKFYSNSATQILYININNNNSCTTVVVNNNNNNNSRICPVCMEIVRIDELLALGCEHWFCKQCWVSHAETKISHGSSLEIPCMESKCDISALEDFVSSLSFNARVRSQYEKFTFQNYVKTHPLLKFCVGPNCDVIFKVNEALAKRVICSNCNSTFCFKCGGLYHAPNECATIKSWLTKCADDSETANYFIAHTKDCPQCNICIEKNGGCNHMQCYKCKYDFCWMCLGDWKLHGSEYYECSRYKENADSINETAKARAALKKYLHYYERWQNHAKSLKLEEQTLEKIRLRIDNKVMNASGTWIDWQYLIDAAALLAKCRYTLQYTYPYAYYLKSPRKDLFEYQQAQLEAEIENLSWKIERAETTDRGDLENQMYVAEKRRKTLLKDFFHF